MTNRILPHHIPSLDGIRGIAILLVLMVHSPFIKILPFTWCGVDLFFVLSGFLITGILLDSKSSPNYFKNFYIRRCLRIWPLYYAFLIIMFAFSNGPIPSLTFDTQRYHWQYYAFYIQNLFLSLDKPKSLSATWSLAIEEQFYILWPLLVYFLSPKNLWRLSISFLFLAPLFRLFLPLSGHSHLFSYSFTLARTDSLAIGALIAMIVRSPDLDIAALKKKALYAIFLFLPVGIGIAAIRAEYYSLPAFVLIHTCLGFGFGGVIIWAIFDKGTLLTKILQYRFLTFCGKVSYGLYIYHMVILIFGQTFLLPPLLQLTEGASIPAHIIKWVGIYILNFVVAFVSWHLFEQPILRLKKYFE